MTDEGVSPIGLWNFADAFFKAAECLKNNYKGNPTVTYYLTCHAIELWLKAFLRAKKASLNDLKGISHDLEKLLGRADNDGISSYYEIPDSLRIAVRMINPLYKDKHLEYFKRGTMTLPSIDLLLSDAKGLSDSIVLFCNEQTRFEEGHEL